MDEDQKRRVLMHLQHLARHFLAWRGTMGNLLEFIVYSMKDEKDPPPIDRIENLLRRTETQDLLMQHFEVSLFMSTDKSWHLISLAIPLDAQAAVQRLARRPASPGTQCAFCWQDSRHLASYELVPEVYAGQQVPGVYLHPGGCRRAWSQLRALSEQTGAKTKESLL